MSTNEKNSVTLTEHEIQRQILDWLKHHRIFAWRHNVGAMKGKYNGKDWFMRFGQKGQPDIFAVRPVHCIHFRDSCSGTETIGIEVKSQRGEQSQAQREWQTEFEKAGGIYVLARCLEDVQKVLQ